MEPVSSEHASPFWKMPIPSSLIFFVDSPEKFAVFAAVLRRSYLVGADCEWKPLSSRLGNKGGKGPKVSILQIACRFRNASEPHNTAERITQDLDLPEFFVEKDLLDVSSRDSPAEAHNSNSLNNFSPQGCSMENLSSKDIATAAFILDMLALSPDVFSETLEAMLRSPKILKLGYALRDDMRFLAANHPGFHAFDEVEPYVDVRNMYRTVRLDKGYDSANSKAHCRPSAIIGGGLSGVVEGVLGYPLCKELQCSNWEERPLSMEQLEYAAADAYCLMDIFDKLSREVDQCNPSMVQVSRGLKEILYTNASENSDVVQSCQETSLQQSVEGIQTISINSSELESVSFFSKSTKSGPLLLKRSIQTEALISQIKEEVPERTGCQDTCQKDEKFSEEKHVYDFNAWWSFHWNMAVNKFGVKLDVHDTSHTKQAGKSRKKVGGSQAVKKKQWDDIDLEWIGPPPWQKSIGGDGVPRFLCDIMVEGLARQLRCVGIDAESRCGKLSDIGRMVEQAEKEGRVILSRDIKVIRSRMVSRGMVYRVNNVNKMEQLKEIVKAFSLEISREQLLSRCTRCNGIFIPTALTAKEASAAALWTQSLPQCVLNNVTEFWQCSACRHLYWEGTQFDRALQQFESVCTVNVNSEGSSSSVFERSTGQSQSFFPLRSSDVHDNGGSVNPNNCESNNATRPARENLTKCGSEKIDAMAEISSLESLSLADTSGRGGYVGQSGKSRKETPHVCGCKGSSRKLKKDSI